MQPSEQTVGVEGFKGYVIYSYPQIGIHVFESYCPGNATYAFRDNWKTLQRYLKLQLLGTHCSKVRVVHTSNLDTQNKRFIYE